MKHSIKIVLAIFALFLFAHFSLAQSPICDPNTPVFTADLSNDPNGTWTSPAVPRAGNCCGTVAPDKCVEIKLTLSPQAVAINFQIASGAVPPGALFYQIACGPQVAVGSPICLNGPGPYILTFCKPGNNINSYAITSIPAPSVSPDDTIGNGCSTTMHASGLLVNTSISWNSVYPGSYGQYNSYLSCTTGCDSTVVTGNASAPAYVDYVVCGMPAAGACVSSGLWCDTIRIYFSPPITNTILPNPAVFCASNVNGITLTGTPGGGVPPYTYAWTNGANGTGTVVGTGTTYTATAGGTYSFIVYDKNYPACPAQITSVPVTVSPVPVVNAGPDQNVCGTSATLNATITGATGGTWSGGNGTFSPNNSSLNATYTPTASELSTGTVILTLTSTGNGSCTPVSDQVVIHISPPINVTITAPSVICFGQTGTLTANVTGGIPPYSYLWNTGQTSQTLTNVAPGTYSISVTGANGSTCVGTASLVLTTNPQIVVTTSPNNSISCSTTATISATASGGTGILIYSWSNGASTPSTTVYSGSYVITVTDAVGCTANNSVNVQAANSSLTAMINQPPVLCNGATTTLSVIANGGFGGYTYSWSTGATTSSIVAGAGNYCCTVTDGGGCITSACVTVTQNPVLSLSVPIPSTICNGTTASVNAYASGGQAPYSYLWNTGQNTQSITALAGNYTVTVTDAIGCTKSSLVTISQAPPLNVSPTSVSVGCFGGNNGSATASVTGGTPSYFYSWSPYGGSSSTASGLMAGSFTVTVTDAIGCTQTSTVTVTQPAAIAATVSINNNVSCAGGNNGSATVNPTGGTPGYFYSWNPFGGSGQSASNLTAGNYFISISDTKGCSQTTQVTITQPTQLTASIVSTTNVSCNGGSNGAATVSATGGTPGYTYSWAPTGGTSATATNLSAGTYTVSITDSKGCLVQLTVTIDQAPVLTATISGSTNVSCNSGNNGTATVTAAGGTGPYTYSWNTNPVQTTATATNLIAGSYSATVTDAKGCIATSSAATITQPTVLTVTATPNTFISCTSTIAISASASGGGSGSYTYTWSNGSTGPSITVNTGTYSVTATDGFGCTANTSVSVQASNSTLAASINPVANICNGSTTTISVNVSGGLGSNTFLWSTNETSQSIVAGAGSYCVTVTDAGGCVANACVSIVQNPPISVSIGTPPNVCPGGSTTITAVGSGGQSPYSFLWTGGQTTASVAKPVGSYTVTISDVTGSTCSATATVSISQEPTLIATMGSTNVGCFGGANGSAIVYASGGMPGYTYSWAPYGGSNSSAYNLAPGGYTVTVTDFIGCTQTGNVTITQPMSAVSMTLTETDVLCFGQANGTATASGSGGSGAPYAYYWFTNGSSSPTLTGLTPSTYSVTVADSVGCYTTSSITVSQPADITLSDTAFATTCGYNNGSATVTPNGGTGAFTYSWAPAGGTAATATNIFAGNYTVTATDANGCSKQLPVTVPSISSTLNANFSTGAGCLGVATNFNDLSTATNDTVIAWSWNFGDTTSSTNASVLQNPSHVYTSPGTFTTTLAVTTLRGCKDTFVVTVNVNLLPVVSFSADTSCVNSISSFINNSSISTGSISSWHWNFGDTASNAADSSILQNPTHVFTTAGTFSVVLTATSNNGCSASAGHSILVLPSPAASFSATVVCKNSPTQFTDQSTPGGGPIVSWLWNFGDGSNPDSTQNPTHTYANGGVYNVVLKVTSTNGCGNYDTVQINVYPGAIPNFTAPDVCLHNPTLFSNQTSNTGGSVVSSWNWDFGNFTPVNHSASPNYVYAATGTFNVTLTVITTQGCTTSVMKPVHVYALPVANFTNNTACENSPTQFNDASAVPGGGTVTSWLWAFGDGSPIDTLQNPLHTYASAGSYNASFVVKSGSGCADTITKPVIVNPSPLVHFVVFDSSGCATYCTKFTDVSIAPGSPIVSWLWDFGDSSLTGTTAVIDHCFPNSGLYTITLTVTTSNGCKGTETQTNLITVYPVPDAEFTLTPQETTTLSSEIYFTDQSIDAVKWSWDFNDPNDAAFSYLQNPKHFYEDSGRYCVVLTVENIYHCKDTVTHCLLVNPEFTFYIPNAFTPGGTEGLNDDFGGVGTNITQYEMWIFDRWGNMIFHTNDLKHRWDGRANGGKNVAQEDVYVYLVELLDFQGNKHKYRGKVTIVK